MLGRFATLVALAFVGFTAASASSGCSPSVRESDGAAGGTPSPSDDDRPQGKACGFGTQCASGYCSAKDDGCGTCLALRLLGEACGASGVTCNDSATCRDGVCVSTKATEGGTCMLGGLGDSTDCDDELFCDGPGNGAGVCRKLPAVGAPCAKSVLHRCLGRAVCEDDICTSPSPGKLGESCDNRQCVDGLVCHSTGEDLVCEEPDTIPEGDACGVGNLDCAPGTSCETTEDDRTSICRGGRSEGEECASNHCAEGLDCGELDGSSTFTCQPLRKEGESCYSFACAPGLECRGDTCRTACR